MLVCVPKWRARRISWVQRDPRRDVREARPVLQKEEGPRWPKRQKAPEEHNILKQNKYEEIFFFFFLKEHWIGTKSKGEGERRSKSVKIRSEIIKRKTLKLGNSTRQYGQNNKAETRELGEKKRRGREKNKRWETNKCEKIREEFVCQ